MHAAMALISGIPNILSLNISIITIKDNKLEGNEYNIIIGFPKSRGMVHDFIITIVIDGSSPRIITVKITTMLPNPIFINGKIGIIGGISISNNPMIMVIDSSSAVYETLRIMLCLCIFYPVTNISSLFETTTTNFFGAHMILSPTLLIGGIFTHVCA